MSSYLTRSSSFASDTSMKNHLPPKGKQRPLTQQTKSRKKTRTSKKLENTRPASATVPLWDHNNPLEISSTPIPLSARGRIKVATPTKYRPFTSSGSSRILTKANSLSNLVSGGGTSKQLNYISSSRSQIEFVSDHHSLSVDSNFHCEDLNESFDQLTSEIDDILHDINNGVVDEEINHSPMINGHTTGGEPHSAMLVEQTIDSEQDGKFQPIASYTEEENLTDSVSFHDQPNDCKEKELINEMPVWMGSEPNRIGAAVKIQKWYRERREQRRRKNLQDLLKTKREEVKNQIEQTVLNEEQGKKEEREQRRESKMRAARQAAIETLKQKREERKKESERIVQEEMAILEAKGKLKKKPIKKKQQAIDEKATLKQKDETEIHEKQEDNNTTDSNKRVEKSDQLDNQVEEFFKAGPRKPTPHTSPSHVTPSPSHQQTSTMESIFATLKELEEVPPPLQEVDPSVSVGYLSATNLQKLPEESTPNNKLQSILTYLDEVENNASNETNTNKDTKEVNEQLEAASSVANDVRTTIVTQRLEIENKNKTVEMLQKSLAQQRELTVYHAKEMEKESQKRLDLQKQEYETTIQRHQCFIDQLIDDKKVLSEKCEQLIKELKETNKKHKTKITTMEDNHATELEKQKQTFAAAEKLRREKWRTEETQRIKEATVKSLEPEIQRIIAKGKAEIQKLKALHEAELLQADERASKRFIKQTEELRIQHAQEKEMACQHERELARQKYEQLAEQEERSYQQLRKKLYSELQQERDKLSAELTGHNSAIEKQMKELKEIHSIEISRLKQEYESSIAELKESHSLEFRDLHERSKIEKQMWEENYFKKQDAILMTREREMREKLRKERDMEIETVIHKLEAETAVAKEECERGAESRIKRIREKYETELKEVEKSERNTLQKFNSMKTQLTDLEGEVIKLRSHLRLKEEEVSEVNEIATRLTKERDQFAEVVRHEFNDRLIAIEQENRQFKLEMSEMEAKHKLELERLQRSKERELAEVHNRVKQALAKKEENQKMLKIQHEAALKRADHLEMLLEQQRKELLKR